jgi:hypothetical protein
MGITYNSSVVRNGLVLHLDAANPKSYPGSGTTWNDLSGFGNNGTLVNGVGYSTDNKGAMVFDKTTDYTTLGNTPSFRTNTSGTISGFVKMYSFGITSNNIVSKGGSSASGGSFVQLWEYRVQTNGSLHFRMYGTGDNNILVQGISTNTIPLNEWVLLTVTQNNGLKMYFNSQEVSTIITGSAQNSWFNSVHTNHPYSVGGFKPYTDTGFTTLFGGNISSVKIYNRALTAAEIRQNFEATRGRYGI